MQTFDDLLGKSYEEVVEPVLAVLKRELLMPLCFSSSTITYICHRVCRHCPCARYCGRRRVVSQGRDTILREGEHAVPASGRFIADAIDPGCEVLEVRRTTAASIRENFNTLYLDVRRVEKIETGKLMTKIKERVNAQKRADRHRRTDSPQNQLKQ